MPIGKISDLATDFPTVEVDFSDLFGLTYRTDGRFDSENGIDCIGVVLEVYRRAGLLLPDPKIVEGQVFHFSELFDKVDTPDQLYDLINIRRDSHHVMVVVRSGIALSATSGKGVYTARVNILKRVTGVEFFRVRTDSLPT